MNLPAVCLTSPVRKTSCQRPPPVGFLLRLRRRVANITLLFMCLRGASAVTNTGSARLLLLFVCFKVKDAARANRFLTGLSLEG